MSLTFRIAGPLVALTAPALVIAGWLGLQAPGGVADGAAADRRVLALAGRLAAAREAHRMASRLAMGGLAMDAGPLPPFAGEPPAMAAKMSLDGKATGRDPPAAGPTVAPAGTGAAYRVSGGGARALLQDAVATALSDSDAMRMLAAGQPFEAATRRLAAEFTQWRDLIERAVVAEAAGRGAPNGAFDALAAQGRLIDGLSESLAERLAQAQAARASHLRDAALHAVGLILAGLLLTALVLCWTMGRFAQRLSRDVARLPCELEEVVRGTRQGPLSGESRRDEVGAMARDLRTFGQRMRQLTQSSAEMRKMALSDPLTGLPNRRALHEFLGSAAEKASWADGGTIAVIHLDLDHFKAINDTHGHEAGDDVLREATRRMAAAVRDTDLLARVGGDEFVIVAQGLTSGGSLERLVNRLVRRFDAPFTFRDRTVQVTASLGAVLGGLRGEVPDPKRLLINADIALSQAKAGGRNRWSIFTSEMARDARRREERAGEISAGIQKGEFRVWFRPVMDMRSGRTVAFDLVSRWLHPEMGVLRDDDFVDTAEAQNLTGAIVMPALERALDQVAGWRRTGLTVPYLHIGMSRTMLLAPDIVDRLRWLLDERRIDPGHVAIAIFERFCSGRGSEAVFANLRRFAALGAGLVIDDFGSVDGALGTITRLGVSTIKVDAARTDGLVGQDGGRIAAAPEVYESLAGVIRIGKSLGVTVLASGVADDVAKQSLRASGFDLMQGDAIAPALDAAAASRWLSRGTAGPGEASVRLAAG